MPFILAASAAGALPQIAITNSMTWVPPQDGNICIHLIGGGGAGQGSTSNNYVSGGAGGYCKKNSLAVTTSGSFTIVVGAGGLPNGGNGGNTTVAGTGLSSTLTANGGTGGVDSGSASTGGTASNGDVNNTGGSGVASGGGAVGIYGTGDNGSADYYNAGCTDSISSTYGLEHGYGYIAGGVPGQFGGGYDKQAGTQDGMITAGPLSGGGMGLAGPNMSPYRGFTFGGQASIGGGGGGSRNYESSGNAKSGKGGEGIVLIHYLP